MIKNILFDLGNVLIDVDIRKTLRAFGTLREGMGDRLQATGDWQQATGNRQQATGYWLQATGNRREGDRLMGESNTIITAGDLLGAGESGLVAKYQVGEISTDEFINAILTICKPGTTRQDVIDAWMAMLVGIPEARKQKLLELHKAGYKLYVLSNINELHVEWTKEQLKDIPFEQMFFSNEIHLAKPDVRCYEMVIRETGIKPEETLYIDDLPANIEAGQKAGFECFLNDRADKWVEYFYRITH
ncbi:MAG: HAD family phosphatase [Paludibacteraceae bacterium]|nr:HAD family phosphatase [Paludibacteraceae bacterium]